MTMVLSSSAFEPNRDIPAKYTADGEDVSPPLSWQGVPEGTQEFVLICDDPDAPTPDPWVHWVMYKIPGSTRSLPEAIPPQERLEQPAGALQGVNSWHTGRRIGYRGPSPPPGSGVHHYHFKLYALDAPLDLPPGATKEEVLRAIQGHVLAQAELVGTYRR